jgi:hypothetical protein
MVRSGTYHGKIRIAVVIEVACNNRQGSGQQDGSHGVPDTNSGCGTKRREAVGRGTPGYSLSPVG